MSRPLLPFSYYGGKAKIVKWLVERMPDGDHFVDLFCGSAVVALNVNYHRTTINDRHDRLINFFRVLRERPDELVGLLELTPYSRSEHAAAWEVSPDPVEDARRFFVRATSSFAGICTRKAGWCRTTGSKIDKPGKIINKVEGLAEIAERLRGFQIDNKPAIEAANDYGKPGAVLYADPPPYDLTVRSGGIGYGLEMSEADHRELAETLNGLPCAAAVSGYRSELYDELYSGWELHERGVKSYTSVTGGDGIKPRTECLWVKR